MFRRWKLNVGGPGVVHGDLKGDFLGLTFSFGGSTDLHLALVGK